MDNPKENFADQLNSLSLVWILGESNSLSSQCYQRTQSELSRLTKLRAVKHLTNSNQIEDVDCVVFESLEDAGRIPTQIEKVLIVSDSSTDLVIKAKNEFGVSQFVAPHSNEEIILSNIKKSLDRAYQQKSKSELLKRDTKLNRELENLNTNLEKIVEERTRHIESSHEEEKNKHTQLQSIIKFIKQVADVNSIDQVLNLLRKDIRRFHKLGEPVLIMQEDSKSIQVISFQGGRLLESRSNIEFNFDSKTNYQNSYTSKWLANHFSRPFVKVITFPIEAKLVSDVLSMDYKFNLCIEYSANEKELKEILNYLHERIQIINMSVDRILLETILLKYSLRWEKTFDAIQAPICIIDKDFILVRSNKSFSGASFKQACYSQFAGKDKPCEGCPVGSAILEKKSKSGQIRAGNRFYDVLSYPIISENGSVSNLVNYYLDKTEERELYMKILQSEKMGAIGLLAGNIAHELNNPLTGLRSLAQVLLADTNIQEQVRSDLLEVEKAAERSQKIIKNLLEFSQSGELLKQIVSVQSILDKTMPMLKMALRPHRLKVEFETENILVKVEPQLLQQVIFNIVNNACQAVNQNGEIEIKTKVCDDQVIISIKDNGPGMSEEIQQRIFEPFFTTKKEGEGTGLGLSTAKSIIEKFGGRISLNSKLGEGSEFVIEIPRAMDS